MKNFYSKLNALWKPLNRRLVFKRPLKEVSLLAIAFLCVFTLQAQSDCCDTGGDKVQTFTFEYTGQNCGASNNDQGSQGDKWDCDDFNGGPGGDNSVYIISSKEDDGNGDVYFAGTVGIGETFTASSLLENDDDFPSRTYHLIYSAQGGTLLQIVEVHASCSAPVVIGDQFGSLILRNATFKNGYSCGPTTPPTNNPNCNCQSGIYTVTFTYNGQSGIGGGPYDYHDNELGYWSNLVQGQSYTFNISNTNHDHWHEHNDPIFWTYQNGWINHGTMDSSCDSDVLGNSYGPFTITGWIDLQGNQCSLNQECDNVTDGGSISGNETDCGPFDPSTITNVEDASGNSNPANNNNNNNNNGSGCCNDTHSDGAGGHNHVKSLNLLYNGPSGNVNLYTNDGSGGTGVTNITQFVENGETVVFEAAGSQKYGSNSDWSYPGGSVELHTSCSQNDVVLGANFGPFEILGIETANGCSEGEFGPPPPPPSEPIIYQWIQSTSGCPDNISQAIPGANGASYNPSFISQTTWYVRLAKRELCEEDGVGEAEGWVASNCIMKTVEEDICACLGQNDTDNDGVCDPDDNCVFNPNPNQADNDGDGIGNLCDNCPNNFNPNQSDSDGDGIGDACDSVDPCFGTGDSDGDGICDPEDNCVSNSNPSQIDSDGDGIGNVCDNCPNAFNNSQLDSDGDGIGNVCDNCPNNFNPNQSDSDGDGIGDACDSVDPCFGTGDSDGDGICDPEDNCISTFNPSQADSDGDGIGNVCDNCPSNFNPNQADSDGDGIGNVCDNCPSNFNPNQSDSDGDGIGDACDSVDPCFGTGDSDGDGICDPEDNCVSTFNPNQADNDGDGVGNVCDNCPSTFNPNQADSDGDGIGNACESGDPCSVNVGPCSITINGLTASDYAKVFDANWNVLWECNPWGGGNCSSIEIINLSANGSYWVQACGETNPYSVSGCGTDPCAGLGDSDGDGVCNPQDNCPFISNPNQADNDNDGVGNVCDNCPNTYNPNQADSDGDGIGNACESVDPCAGLGDSDGDGVCNPQDNCQFTSNPNQMDSDNDGVGNVCDNCPNIYNPNQADSDGDGIGNACESVDPCNNYTYGGEIGFTSNCFGSYILCDEPVPTLTNCATPSGGSGSIEVVWLKSVGNPNCNMPTQPISNIQNDPYWSVIPGETSLSLNDPGYITEKTCFLRCVRRAGCENYIESNIIAATLDPDCDDNNGGTCDDISVVENNGAFYLSDYNYPIVFVKVYTSGWSPVYDSGMLNNSSSHTTDALSPGSYIVSIQTFDASWNTVCNELYYLDITGGNNDPCANSGGDSDNDGVCNYQDNCPNTYNPGQVDNDNDGIGNPCDDTPDGEPGNDCDDIAVSVQSGAFYVTGYNAPIAFIKVYDSGWSPLYNSNMLSNSNSHLTDHFGTGSYIVHVQTFDASWNPVCNELFHTNISGNSFAVGDQIFDFQATRNAREVSLIWMTNTESFNDYFVIEHSTDGENFSPISEVSSMRSSNGAFNYSDQDEQPKFGDNFYRIKKVHTDGSILYSSVRKVFFDVELSETAVFPNPAGDEVFVNLSEFEGKRIKLSIFNQYGQIMDMRELEEMGTDTERFDLSRYPSGTYVIYIDIDGQKNFARRFIKSKL